MIADTNTQQLTSTTRNNNAADRARPDVECRATASNFLTGLTGSPHEDLVWDDTHLLQGHSRLDGLELVVIAPRDKSHQTVVLTAEDWDAVRRANADQRRDLLAACAIADHKRLVAVISDHQTLRAA